VIKKPCKRGGYTPARGLQNINPQWVVAPIEKKGVYIRTNGLWCFEFRIQKSNGVGTKETTHEMSNASTMHKIN